MNRNRHLIGLAAASLITSTAHAQAPATPVDIGPKPTADEALQYARTWASKARQGSRTKLGKVQVVGPVRWHAALTARWPEGTDGKTLEGWLITLEEQTNWVVNPYAQPRKVELLVDRDKAVHWRTQMEWDTRNREVRP